MLTDEEILALNPPDDLHGEALREWYLQRLCEPDGSFIMADTPRPPDPEPESA